MTLDRERPLLLTLLLPLLTRRAGIAPCSAESETASQPTMPASHAPFSWA
jgi:hypothetical protein